MGFFSGHEKMPAGTQKAQLVGFEFRPIKGRDRFILTWSNDRGRAEAWYTEGIDISTKQLVGNLGVLAPDVPPEEFEMPDARQGLIGVSANIKVEHVRSRGGEFTNIIVQSLCDASTPSQEGLIDEDIDIYDDPF